MFPHFILSDIGTEFRNQLMDNVLEQIGIDHIFSTQYHAQSNGKLEVSTNTLNLLFRNFMKRIQTTVTNTSTKY